jgi:hypothetical protein
MTKRKALSIRLVAAAAVAVLAAAFAGTASAGDGAGTPGKYTQACPSFPTAEPFRPWLDSGAYFLGPAADFESSLTGWTAKGAKIVSGNESYYVTAPTDSHSLLLPKSSTATTPSICVTLDTPDLRLFVENTGTSAATLTINMTYTNNLGRKYTVAVAKIPVAAKASWAPTIPVLFLANIQSILSSNNQTWVTFEFASNGALQIDDFYVDPMKHH